MKANSLIPRAFYVTLVAWLLGLVGWVANPALFHIMLAMLDGDAFSKQTAFNRF